MVGQIKKAFTAWVEQILVPSVGQNQCLLLMDSFEGHICENIRVLIKRYPTIHSCIIPGGFTDTLQPPDMGINSVFKKYRKEVVLDCANKLIETLARFQENKNLERKDVKITVLTGMISLS